MSSSLGGTHYGARPGFHRRPHVLEGPAIRQAAGRGIMIHITCACGETYHADETHIGRAIECSRCGRILAIQAPTASASGARLAPEPPRTPRQPAHSARHAQRYPRTTSARMAVPSFASIAIVLGLVVVATLAFALGMGSTDRKPLSAATQAVGRLPSDVVLSTGEELWPVQRVGHGMLVVENGTEFDAVVKLVNERTMETERVVFVRAGATATVRRIATGRYILRYGLGWDVLSSGTFSRHAHYGEFERRPFFTETSQQMTTYEVTLHKVAGGDATALDISEADFLESDRARLPEFEAIEAFDWSGGAERWARIGTL